MSRNDFRWKRLIRFRDETGTVRYGEPQLEESQDLLELWKADHSIPITAYKGTNPFEITNRSETVSASVKEILPILESKDVPVIKCVGLNYMKHIQEGGRSAPPFPSIFLKPRTCIAAYNEDIPIPRLAQDDQCDYEGELSIVIGQTGRNISKVDALDYVAGYLPSNDVSSRKWQRDLDKAGSVPQWCFSKGFDKYAPVGPMMVSPSVVGDAGNLRIQTFVNGESRQDSNTSDMLFGVREIISFISQGSTLEQGTVIMTGTPSGVAFGMKPKPVWLKDGDVVEVRIEKLGSCRNRMHFE